MKKHYVIQYKPNNFKDIFAPEFTVTFTIVQLGSIIFTLVNNMFVEDLIGALAFVLFPIVIFSIGMLVMFLLSLYKLTFDYKTMKFIKQTVFKRKTYDLNQLKIENKYIKCAGNNPDLLKIYISIEGKTICKIDANSFEKKTGFNVESILDQNWE